eukprot:791573-Prorocentrum_minimum.AAC.1
MATVIVSTVGVHLDVPLRVNHGPLAERALRRVPEDHYEPQIRRRGRMEGCDRPGGGGMGQVDGRRLHSARAGCHKPGCCQDQKTFPMIRFHISLGNR